MFQKKKKKILLSTPHVTGILFIFSDWVADIAYNFLNFSSTRKTTYFLCRASMANNFVKCNYFYVHHIKASFAPILLLYHTSYVFNNFQPYVNKNCMLLHGVLGQWTCILPFLTEHCVDL